MNRQDRTPGLRAGIVVLLALLLFQTSCIVVWCPSRPCCPRKEYRHGEEEPTLRVLPGGEPPPMESRQGAISVRWDMIWYIINEIQNFQFVAINGGAVGSHAAPIAGIIVRNLADPNEHEWLFVTGRSFPVWVTGQPPVYADQPGEKILSGNQTVGGAVPDDKWVTMKMLTIHDLDASLLHAPILTGRGWNPNPAGVKGATREEADDILRSLGLQPKFLGSGRVASTTPPGGVVVSPGQLVEVHLKPDATPIAVAGDTFTTAIPVTDPTLDYTGELTVAHSDALPVGTGSVVGCFGLGPDVFFRLPDGAVGTTVTADERTMEMVVLSAWARNPLDGSLTILDAVGGGPACGQAIPGPPNTSIPQHASVSFLVPNDLHKEYYVMVEHRTRATAMFKMRFSW